MWIRTLRVSPKRGCGRCRQPTSGRGYDAANWETESERASSNGSQGVCDAERYAYSRAHDTSAPMRIRFVKQSASGETRAKDAYERETGLAEAQGLPARKHEPAIGVPAASAASGHTLDAAGARASWTRTVSGATAHPATLSGTTVQPAARVAHGKLSAQVGENDAASRALLTVGSAARGAASATANAASARLADGSSSASQALADRRGRTTSFATAGSEGCAPRGPGQASAVGCSQSCIWPPGCWHACAQARAGANRGPARRRRQRLAARAGRARSAPAVTHDWQQVQWLQARRWAGRWAPSWPARTHARTTGGRSGPPTDWRARRELWRCRHEGARGAWPQWSATWPALARRLTIGGSARRELVYGQGTHGW